VIPEELTVIPEELSVTLDELAVIPEELTVIPEELPICKLLDCCAEEATPDVADDPELPRDEVPDADPTDDEPVTAGPASTSGVTGGPKMQPSHPERDMEPTALNNSTCQPWDVMTEKPLGPWAVRQWKGRDPYSARATRTTHIFLALQPISDDTHAHLSSFRSPLPTVRHVFDEATRVKNSMPLVPAPG